MEIRPRINGNKKTAYENITKKETRVLVIGDLHEPFCLNGYLEHCQETYAKYNCNRVVFIGDVIDNHYSSYHESDADGLGGGQELELAISKIANWYNTFPKAHVTIGNHDRLIMRKAQTSAVPKKWIKAYKDVLEVPQWKFVDRVVIDDVQYKERFKILESTAATLYVAIEKLSKRIDVIDNFLTKATKDFKEE